MIGLTYDNTLSRVQIALSDMPDGTVLVERSAQASFNLRETVRGGRALPISGGVANLNDHEFAADALNHYRTVPVDPPAGLLLTGASGDYASTPDDPALDITADIVITVDVTLDDWASGSTQVLLSKFDASVDQRSYSLLLTNTGNLRLIWSTDGTSPGGTGLETTDPLPVSPGQRLAVKAWLNVDNGAGNHAVTFYTAPTAADTFTALESVTDTGITSIFASNVEVKVGTNAGETQTVSGVIHKAIIQDGSLAGTEVANPDFAAQPGGTTSFTDTAGRAWTVNGDARIVGTETASITPSLAGRVWLKSLKYPLLNRIVTVSDYGDVTTPSRNASFPIAGRSLPIASTELHGGRNHRLDLVTDNPDDAANLDLMLRTGRVFLVHVPTTAPPQLDGNPLLPGSMYITIGTPRRHRVGGVSEVELWELPLTEVNPPGPDVTEATLTWQTIERVYGSWSNVWAAHSDWRSVWATIGAPTDVYVP